MSRSYYWLGRASCTLLFIFAVAEFVFSFSPSQGLPPGRTLLETKKLRRSKSKLFLSSKTWARQGSVGDDLSREELTSRFSEVLAYYRETKEISEDNLCLSMLRTRLPNLSLNRCFVGQSNITGAGRGLFASRDIFQGELITCFPGDALLIWNTTVGDIRKDVGVMFGKHIPQADRPGIASRILGNEARVFEMKIGMFHSIVGEPLLVEDAAYLGHMANDGAKLTETDEISRELYAKKTLEQQNAAFFGMEGCHHVTIATKKIMKNEEIYVSYGDGYWLSRIVPAHTYHAKVVY